MKPLILITALLGVISLGIQETTAQGSQPPILQQSSDSTIYSLHSTALGEAREISVHLPWSYSQGEHRYPVIYVFDGEFLATFTKNASDFLTGMSTIPQMPEVIVVGVSNVDRNRDMPIPQEYGQGREQRFLAFVADELAPAVDASFRTEPLRIVAGTSQGGLFSLYALANRPDMFSWCLSMDAPVHGFREVDPLAAQLKERMSKSDPGLCRLVSAENLYGWKASWPAADQIESSSWFAQRIDIVDETHETMTYKGLYDGLKALFHDYAPNIVRQPRASYSFIELLQLYQTKSDAYGYSVEIPEALLMVSAERKIAGQQGAEAAEILKHAVKLYGASRRRDVLLARAEEAIRKGRNPRLDEWDSLPAPSVAQMAPFLGAWRFRVEDGAQWFLTFEEVQGAIRSRAILSPPSGGALELELHFVKVIGDRSIQWGVRNGRGPGTNVHTGEMINENGIIGSVEGVGFIRQFPPEEFHYQRIPLAEVPALNEL